MIDELQYQLEIRETAATLYLAGSIQPHDVPLLRAVCHSLPPTVLTLRVDFHALRTPGPGAVSATRAMLHDWRTLRDGTVHLSLHTSHLVATYRELSTEVASAPASAEIPSRDRHAVMATFRQAAVPEAHRQRPAAW